MNATDFFKVKKFAKCHECTIETDKETQINFTDKQFVKRTKGSGDILFLFEMPEEEYTYDKFEKFLAQQGIHNYTFAISIQCQTKGLQIPKPLYKPYATCKFPSDERVNAVKPKVIVVIGKSLFSIATNDDLGSWQDFSEFNFNQSYFLTGYTWQEKIRVYPIPYLYDIFAKDGFHRYFANLQLTNIRDYLTNFAPEKVEPFEIIEVLEPNKFLSENLEAKEVAWDIETSGLDHFSDSFNVGCITMTFDGKTGYFLDYDKIDKGLLSQFFENKYQILAFGKFDCIALLRDGVRNVKVDEDITLLFHMLFSDRPTNSLKALAWLVGFGGYEDKLHQHMKRYDIKNFLKVPQKILMEYATLDSLITYRVYKLGLELAKKQRNLYRLYKNTFIPSQVVFQNMELEGLFINAQRLNEFHYKLRDKAQALSIEIKNEIGNHVNIDSPESLGKAFENLNFKELGRTMKGFYKTGQDELTLWAKEHPVIEKIQEYRAVKKLDSAFVGYVKGENEAAAFTLEKQKKTKGIAKFIKSTGKIHPKYSPGRARSLRTICSNPNFQQFPKHSSYAKELSRIIECPDDCLIWSCDYDGIQLRLVQVHSGDPTMKDIFLNQGGDMHSLSAQRFFFRNMTFKDFLTNKKTGPYKTFRQKAKRINFMLIFGMETETFAMELEKEWSDADVTSYINENSLVLKRLFNHPNKFYTAAFDLRAKFFETYSRLEPWFKEQHLFAMKHGYVESKLGARRHIPELRRIPSFQSKKEKQRIDKLFKQTVNSPIQSDESIIVNRAMVKVHNAILEHNMKSQILFMRHDEIGGITPKAETKDLYYLLKENMEDHTTFEIPFTVEVSYGTIWGQGEEVTESNVASFG